jgi:hypothetical protein
LFDPKALGPEVKDRLGRGDEAARLARSLHTRMIGDDTKSFVLAINGPWGSGKTTFGRYLAYHLRNLARDGSSTGDEPSGRKRLRKGKEQRSLVFLECDLWLNALRGRVLKDFLRTLSRHTGSDAVGLQDESRAFTDVLLTALVRAELPEKIPPEETAAVLEDKKRVAQTLINGKQRFMLFLDDIDRFTRDEMRVFLWLLKMVADLPRVCFVVMWDGPLVAQMIGKDFPGRGEDYVARIVDATYDLRRPASDTIRAIFGEYVGFSAESACAEVLREVWQAGLGQLVATLRQAKRLANAVHVRREAGGCTDMRLLLALEGLRVLEPTVFDSLRRRREAFLAGTWDWDPAVKRHVASENRQAVRGLLTLAARSAALTPAGQTETLAYL